MGFIKADMSQSTTPLVSVIIPCYNAGRWVHQAVDSCLAQTYRPIEVIVVDDGSTDDSADILRRYGDRIRFVQQPHTNGNRARNAGMALSRGRYLQFLDADDYLLPEKIASQVALLQETEDDAVYCDYAILTYKDGAPRLGRGQFPESHAGAVEFEKRFGRQANFGGVLPEIAGVEDAAGQLAELLGFDGAKKQHADLRALGDLLERPPGLHADVPQVHWARQRRRGVARMRHDTLSR